MGESQATEAGASLHKEALRALDRLEGQIAEMEYARSEPIAIVGMGCRFPGGVHDPESYWQLLLDGVDAIGPVPAGRWDTDALFDEDPDAPGKLYVARGGFLDDIDRFDAAFFGISAREAISLDPQQRLLLETTWEALEHAGISAASMENSRTGVYVGVDGERLREAPARQRRRRPRRVLRHREPLQLHRRADLLRPGPPRSGRRPRHRMFVVVGRDPPRVSEPARR